MIDLREKGLPNAIKSADGEPILLNTDFRLWIRFYDDVQNDDIDRDISYLFVKEPPVIDNFIFQQLLQFLYNPSSTPNTSASDDKVLDYVQDGEYIFSALYATYGINITEIDMHWHKFKALCDNVIGEGTLWGYAKSMRGYRKPSKNDTYEKQCARAREEWSFPIKLTKEEQKLKEEFDDYFG